MAAEDGLRRDVVDEIVRRVLDHRDLLEHDLALRVELVERRPVHHVRHDVERGLQPVVGDARVDDGRLPRRRGVQLSAELVEDLGDLLGGVARRALEQQVLDEVGDARARVRLVPRACSDPEPECDRADSRNVLGDDALARGELGQLVLGHAVDRTGGVRPVGSDPLTEERTSPPVAVSAVRARAAGRGRHRVRGGAPRAPREAVRPWPAR